MSQSPQPNNPELVVRTSQIIAIALILSVVIFACVAFIIAKGDAPQIPMLSFIGIAFAGINTVLRFVVPMMVVNGAKSKLIGASDPGQMTQLAGLYQTKMIIGMALLEGAAFVSIVAYISEKQLWSYGVVAFLLGVMAISFPSQGQFESWAEEMKRDLN